MNVIFCKPELTMTEVEAATEFYTECTALLNSYVANVHYISTSFQINQLLFQETDKNDILVFFTSEKGVYDKSILKLITKYNDAQSRVWAIAMNDAPECRRPPEPVTDKQSFDVPSRKENRNPLKNNIKAIAQLFARKIIAQTFSDFNKNAIIF